MLLPEVLTHRGNRNVNLDFRTASNDRYNFYLTVHRSDAFVDADQPEGFFHLRSQWVETISVVRNRQSNMAVLQFDADSCRSSFAMLDDIPQ